MASYLININDTQRLALIYLLETNTQGTDDNDSDPLQYWVKMLTELPAVEPTANPNDPTYGKAPSMIHGFCL